MRNVVPCLLISVFLSVATGPAIGATDTASLPKLPRAPSAPPTDWLIDASPYKAAVYRTEMPDEIVLGNGLIRRTFRLAPNAATVGFDNLMTGQTIIRGVKPEAIVTIDGVRCEVGGLTGQPNYAYLLPEWLEQLKAAPDAFRFVGFTVAKPVERFAWKQVRRHAPNATWPPDGVYLRMDYEAPASAQPGPKLRVSVHYELYDGVPVISKWITVHNPTDKKITVDRFTSEMLAVVEHSNWVEKREGMPFPRPDVLHVETDMAFGAFQPGTANRLAVHWRTDPQFHTQVNYLRQTPCLLTVEPTYGPAQIVEPGGTFESFRAFELVHDATDRDRRGLALRRMYRTIAPWVTENPLMMHMRTANPAAVRGAVDQCAEVGFEMLILSFGSGFNVENDSPEYIKLCKDLADYAREKQIEIGGYSLLASRRVGGGNDVVSPPGTSPTFGNCPALTSKWGQDYFRKLYEFFGKTGFSLLEHDGSYPGDRDTTARPPLQRGLDDSQWAQWRIISDFYKWCRANGVYLNVPDFYYLAGSNKCGMGYREVNWSLPRAQQVIHTRQNIYDGTWQKTPSMGWMFVPLTQYHGGGAAATIEPLDEHLDHYRRMLTSNLAMGVQACYRGPRLYDTDRTKAMVKQQVDWFKKYRDILESDVIHGRRADGRELDWMLHVNPKLEHKGMLVVFNPLKEAARRTLKVNLYYTGLTDTAKIREQEGTPQSHELARDDSVEIPVEIGPEGFTWFVVE
ncbi:MAG: alpha-galactosidase [Candidatus Nealsonbacteria bacterium]|nr:alpha-galactosidase [Candidatus Nealsonbacteria bacterium]